MNPRPNSPNPEFNSFSYDPESLRNLLVQLQQNPNIQHFQQHNPNFQVGFAPYSQSGNSQKRENFWKKITVTWHNMKGFDAKYRTYHQLNSKWKDMCTKLTKFSGIATAPTTEKAGWTMRTCSNGPKRNTN
ncbi:hypothetical protein R6Q57_002213 [Mikania cordata]